MRSLEHYTGCLLGLAVGDAVGTTAEFKPRGTFEPIEDMLGGGPFDLQPGEWTDDTSMALCLATSLVDCRGLDAEDQMRRYLEWSSSGYMSSNGHCFDIGLTVSSALSRYERTGDPYAGSSDPYSAGNGSIMRLAPVPMYFLRDPVQAIEYSIESSRTTHAAQECLDACALLAAILIRALSGEPKDDVLKDHDLDLSKSPKIAALNEGSYREKQAAEIRGSGYVVESLEAALWCFYRSDSFEEAVLTAANLGDDADTTAAIAGQIAGAHYGEGGIPSRWIQKLARRKLLSETARRLFDVSLNTSS